MSCTDFYRPEANGSACEPYPWLQFMEETNHVCAGPCLGKESFQKGFLEVSSVNTSAQGVRNTSGQ